MRSFAKRSAALLLALVLALSVFAVLPVFGATVRTHFVFDALRSAQGQRYTASNAGLSLPLSDTAYSFTAEGLSLVAGESNAVYISLVNRSNADAVELTYTYVENAIQKSETVRREISADQEDVQVLLLDTPHISNNVSALSISFVSSDSVEGSVVLHALFNLSAYVDDAAYEAAFTVCRYDPESDTVEIEGTLSFEATAFYGDKHTLALFSLSAGEELHLSSKTPIDRAGISLNFSFSVPVDSSDAIFNRYMVAAVNEKGERIPLCAPIYPTFPERGVKTEGGYKGFLADSFSYVLDSVPGVEIVDVYLDRLPDAADSGILYAGEYSYYHFDREYVESIDLRVRNLTGMGTGVYLRLLVSPDANGLSFTDYTDPGLDIVNKLPAVRTEAAQRDVYAMVDFLTARYADTTVGRISGLVLGRSADLAFTHCYTAATNLFEYTKDYVSVLNLISGTAARNISDARVIVPISDRIWAGEIENEGLGGAYYPELFLTSLMTALRLQCMNAQPFSLMLESAALPDRVTGTSGESYGTDRLNDFFDMLSRVREESTFLDTKVFYCWSPSAAYTAEQLKAAYLWQYLVLFQRSDVTTFIADLSGNAAGAEALSYLVRYVDTDQFETVAESSLRALGANSVSELFEELEKEELLTRKVHRTVLTIGGYAGKTAPTGSFTIWNFNVATGTLGWYAGHDCRNLSVVSDADRVRSLSASMSAAGEYGDMAYHFSEASDLSFAPLMQLRVGIQGTANTRYEIQLRAIGTEDTVIASAIVNEGERTTLFLDLTESKAALSSLYGLRLVARPLDGQETDFSLLLYDFVLESDTLSDTELAERVNAILRGNAATEKENTEKRDLTRPLVVTVILLLASGALIAFLVIRRKTKKVAPDKRTEQSK